jgi:hypothetical protein
VAYGTDRAQERHDACERLPGFAMSAIHFGNFVGSKNDWSGFNGRTIAIVDECDCISRIVEDSFTAHCTMHHASAKTA